MPAVLLKPITYDMIMRVPVLSWAIISAVIQTAGVMQYTKATPIDAAYAIHLAMRLSTVTFLLLLAAAAVLRTRPLAKADGWEPRISALAGGFLMYGVVLFPRCDLSAFAEIVSIFLAMLGIAGAIIALSQLGRSFSVMAESRELVTSGPYRFVRHPLYLAEEIALIGTFMQFASIWTALIFAAQIVFQLRRIHNEETVLSATFPDYDIYRRTTARLVPGLY